MFTRWTKDISFYFKRNEYKFLINEQNLLQTRWIRIVKYRRMIGRDNFKAFIFYVFKQWIDLNFAYTQDFIRKFHKIVRKYDLELTTTEKEFIYNIEEVNFALWRPLKELPITYNLEVREKCYFKNNKVNLHAFTPPKTIHFLGRGDFILTNRRILLFDNETNQNILFSFGYKEISNVQFIGIGVTFEYHSEQYLLRHNNHMLILALLSRVLSRKQLVFDLNQKPDKLYMFNFW